MSMTTVLQTKLLRIIINTHHVHVRTCNFQKWQYAITLQTTSTTILVIKCGCGFRLRRSLA